MNENPLFNSPGWRSRGYLPHLDQPGLIQSVTIRLHDAVPESVIAKWKKELSWTGKMSKRDPRRAAMQRFIEAYEDAGHGACWLGNDRIATMVETSLYIRNENHLVSAIEYAEYNPVKAKLVARKELWKWSSARLHEGRGSHEMGP